MISTIVTTNILDFYDIDMAMFILGPILLLPFLNERVFFVWEYTYLHLYNLTPSCMYITKF